MNSIDENENSAYVDDHFPVLLMVIYYVIS